MIFYLPHYYITPNSTHSYSLWWFFEEALRYVGLVLAFTSECCPCLRKQLSADRKFLKGRVWHLDRTIMCSRLHVRLDLKTPESQTFTCTAPMRVLSSDERVMMAELAPERHSGAAETKCSLHSEGWRSC